jgi:hypothetical protein
MAQLPLNLDLSQMQTKWKSQLDQLLSNELTQGSLISQSLASGSNTINHLLGRQQVGWIIVDQDAAATIYRSQPLNAKTLTLNASAPVNVALWVF